MKIVISTYDSIGNPHYSGGGAVAVHSIARRLARKNSVLVYTFRYGSSVKEEIIDGVTYHRIGWGFVSPKVGQFIFQLLLPYYVLKTTFDIWFESFTPPFATAFLPFFTKKPVVGITHFLDAEEKSKQYHLPFTWIQNAGIKYYKYFIVLTQNQKEKILRQNTSADITIIPNATDVPPAISPMTRPKPYILFMGRIEIAQKGLDILLQSFKKIITHTTLQLYIAGAGHPKDEQTLRSMIRERNLEDSVKIIGRVNGKEKIRLLRNATCLVVPSRFEGQSLTIIESIVLGTPIISFDIAGMKWLDGRYALKAKPFDVDEFAKHIYTIVTNKKIRRNMSLNCLAVSKRYSWESVAKKYSQRANALYKNTMKYNVQVDTEHYDFSSYVHPQRWASFFHQIQAVESVRSAMKKTKFHVLEIGVGDKTVTTILKHHGMRVTTLDIDKTLRPDYVDSLPELKTQVKKKYDCILCCEVLEHLKYEDVEKSFKVFSSLTNNLVISVPQAGGYSALFLQLWYFKKFNVNIFFPSPRTIRPFTFTGEHYWELGAVNYPVQKFIHTANTFGFNAIQHYRIPEFLYHHLFVFKKYEA